MVCVSLVTTCSANFESSPTIVPTPRYAQATKDDPGADAALSGREGRGLLHRGFVAEPEPRELGARGDFIALYVTTCAIINAFEVPAPEESR